MHEPIFHDLCYEDQRSFFLDICRSWPWFYAPFKRFVGSRRRRLRHWSKASSGKYDGLRRVISIWVTNDMFLRALVQFGSLRLFSAGICFWHNFLEWWDLSFSCRLEIWAGSGLRGLHQKSTMSDILHARTAMCVRVIVVNRSHVLNCCFNECIGATVESAVIFELMQQTSNMTNLTRPRI